MCSRRVRSGANTQFSCDSVWGCSDPTVPSMAAAEGDRCAALPSKEMARNLIDRHRTAAGVVPSHTDVDWFDLCQPVGRYIRVPLEKQGPVVQEAAGALRRGPQ